MTTLNGNVVVKSHKSYYCSYGCLNSSLGFLVNSRRRESNEGRFSQVSVKCVQDLLSEIWREEADSN